MSGFVDILKRMVERVPGATCAVFADWDGESVGEYAIDLPEIDIRIIGAQWGLVWIEVQRAFARARLGEAAELMIDGERSSVLVRHVTDNYYVVLAVGSDCQMGKASAELHIGAEALKAEM